MRLLIIEDEKTLAENISEYFTTKGFAVDIRNHGEDGLFQAEEESYDAIILDINLPEISGFEIAKKLRQQEIYTPILMLTARSDETDKIKGLNLGADDYVTKPFSLAEVEARIHALVRRVSQKPNPVMTIGDLVVNPLTHEVTKNDKKIDLVSKEFAVLEFLARHQGEVVTRAMIFDHVWSSDFETLSNVIEVYIRNLRRKLGQPQLIHTIKGSGYKLEKC